MRNSPLLPIFLTVFVDVLGLTLVLPLLPYYAEHFGATPFVATLLTASFAVCQLVASPLLGRLSDRMGRKPVLLASQLGTLVAFVILARANALWMLFLGRMIDGATAGNLTIAQAYISDVTKPENRTKAFALIGIAFGTGFIIGPAISGQLADRFGYSAPFYVAALLSLTSILFTTFLLPNVKPMRSEGDRTRAFARYFELKGPRRRLLEFFAFQLSFATLIGGLALFLERQFQFGTKDTGLVYAFSGLIGGSIQGGVMGRLVKRFGEENLTRTGFALMALGYSTLGLATTVPILLVVTGIASLGNALTRPCLTTLLTKTVGRDEQGAILGVNQSLTSIGSMVAPPIAGYLIGQLRLTAFGIVAGTFATIGLVMTLRDGEGLSLDAPARDP